MYSIVYIVNMSFGNNLLAWRRHRGVTQLELAEKIGVPRPYLSRLEMDKVDPSLSLIRRLSAGLGLRIGELVETLPPAPLLSNEDLDNAARSALKPGNITAGAASGYIRPLSRLLKERRESLGLYKPRHKTLAPRNGTGRHTLRRMRAELGEAQWKALLKRVDKHASVLAPHPNEDK